ALRHLKSPPADSPEEARLLEVRRRPADAVVQPGFPARELLLPLTVGQVELVGELFYRFAQCVGLPVGGQSEQRQHQGLEVRYSHGRETYTRENATIKESLLG